MKYLAAVLLFCLSSLPAAAQEVKKTITEAYAADRADFLDDSLSQQEAWTQYGYSKLDANGHTQVEQDALFRQPTFLDESMERENTYMAHGASLLDAEGHTDVENDIFARQPEYLNLWQEQGDIWMDYDAYYNE